MPTSVSPRPATFEEFWPIYVRAHASKTNRTLHVLGTSLALACLAAAVFKRKPWLALLAPIAGYGLGWCGHLVERSRPTSFSHPLYSVRANLVLWWKTIAGDMDGEVARILGDHEAASEAPRRSRAQQATDLN